MFQSTNAHVLYHAYCWHNLAIPSCCICSSKIKKIKKETSIGLHKSITTPINSSLHPITVVSSQSWKQDFANSSTACHRVRLSDSSCMWSPCQVVPRGLSVSGSCLPKMKVFFVLCLQQRVEGLTNQRAASVREKKRKWRHNKASWRTTEFPCCTKSERVLMIR